MLRSMTAFASRERVVAGATLRWELKSVNHRYLAVNPRLSEPLRSLEPRVRERIDASLGRGKVDATLNCWLDTGRAEVAINWDYADELIEACRSLAARQGEQAGPVSPLELLRLRGVMTDAPTDYDALGAAAMSLLDETMSQLVDARQREGERISGMIRERLDQLKEAVAAVRARREVVVTASRERMRSRLAQLNVEADNARLEQELAIAAQRLDVDEELDRLASHCAEIEASLDSEAPVGRRLDFLMQELNREANTLASKAADAETTRYAVDMKVGIEQMREQVQNIE